MKTLWALKEVIVNERIEFDKSFVEFRDDGIVKIILKDGVHMELRDSLDQHRVLIEKKEYIPFVILVDPGKDTSASKEVRDFSNSHDAAKTTMAQAIVVSNLAHRIIANFMKKFYTTKMELRVFTDEQEAVNWLYKYVDKKKNSISSNSNSTFAK